MNITQMCIPKEYSVCNSQRIAHKIVSTKDTGVFKEYGVCNSQRIAHKKAYPTSIVSR